MVRYVLCFNRDAKSIATYLLLRLRSLNRMAQIPPSPQAAETVDEKKTIKDDLEATKREQSKGMQGEDYNYGGAGSAAANSSAPSDPATQNKGEAVVSSGPTPV